MKFVKDALLQLPACCCLRNVSNFRKLKWNPWSNGSIHVLIIPGSSDPIPHKREVTNQINRPKFFNVKLKLVTYQIWPTFNIYHHVTITTINYLSHVVPPMMLSGTLSSASTSPRRLTTWQASVSRWHLTDSLLTSLDHIKHIKTSPFETQWSQVIPGLPKNQTPKDSYHELICALYVLPLLIMKGNMGLAYNYRLRLIQHLRTSSLPSSRIHPTPWWKHHRQLRWWP